MSFTESKSPTAGPGNPEKQPLLSSIDKSSGLSKSQKPLYLQVRKVSQALESNKTHPNHQIPKSVRINASRKSCIEHAVQKAHRWAHAHKLVDPGQSSYPKKAIKPTWPSSLQCQSSQSKCLHISKIPKCS